MNTNSDLIGEGKMARGEAEDLEEDLLIMEVGFRVSGEFPGKPSE